jgi:TolB protein
MKLKEHVTNMYAISSDGSKINKLTDLELSQQWSAWSFPSISPDRSRIAAALRTGGNSEGIYLISIESQQQRKLTKSGIYPVWSPDGTMISYYDYALWVINASGSRALQLSDAQEGYPSWSPDSTRLAFVLDNNIWIVNTDGTDLTQLTQNGGSLPSWSPDGLQLAFISGSELWAINSDGSEPHRVASGSFVSEKPNWSPNGDKIAFYDSFAIYIVNNNGTNLFRLTPQQYSPTGSFNWSPDGSQIAFTTAQDIYIVNSDGTELMNLTNNDFSAETFLLWPR